MQGTLTKAFSNQGVIRTLITNFKTHVTQNYFSKFEQIEVFEF